MLFHHNSIYPFIFPILDDTPRPSVALSESAITVGRGSPSESRRISSTELISEKPKIQKKKIIMTNTLLSYIYS